MRRHTIKDLEYDLSLLWVHEGEGIPQAILAQREGISPGHLSRRLARARRYRRELERQQELEDAPHEALDPLDYPFMELIDHPLPEWYVLGSDEASCHAGKVHIDNRVRAVDAGQLNGEIGGPTKYDPDPKLKGGIG